MGNDVQDILRGSRSSAQNCTNKNKVQQLSLLFPLEIYRKIAIKVLPLLLKNEPQINGAIAVIE